MSGFADEPFPLAHASAHAVDIKYAACESLTHQLGWQESVVLVEIRHLVRVHQCQWVAEVACGCGDGAVERGGVGFHSEGHIVR